MASKWKNLPQKASQIVGILAGVLTIGFTIWDRMAPSSIGDQGKAPQKNTFFCDREGDRWMTFYNHPERGYVKIIGWDFDYFAGEGYDRATRCKEASARFQKYHKENKLSYLTVGTKNNLNIICVAQSNLKDCIDDQDQGQLFTLKPTEDAMLLLKRLKGLDSGSPNGVISTTIEDRWVSVNWLLNNNPTKGSLRK